MIKNFNKKYINFSIVNDSDISYEMRYNQTPQAARFFVCEMMGRFNKRLISGKYYMNKFRKLKTG